MDDGACHKKSIATHEILLNDKAHLCVAKRGGHLGFLEGWNLKKSWFSRASVEFL